MLSLKSNKPCLDFPSAIFSCLSSTVRFWGKVNLKCHVMWQDPNHSIPANLTLKNKTKIRVWTWTCILSSLYLKAVDLSTLTCLEREEQKINVLPQCHWVIKLWDLRCLQTWSHYPHYFISYCCRCLKNFSICTYVLKISAVSFFLCLILTSFAYAYSPSSQLKEQKVCCLHLANFSVP